MLLYLYIHSASELPSHGEPFDTLHVYDTCQSHAETILSDCEMIGQGH